uniref:Putative ovule protein n=1 Tax=Solanum chacoense TaxID=4108 RepID=A0A0V0H890_SOLCH
MSKQIRGSPEKRDEVRRWSCCCRVASPDLSLLQLVVRRSWVLELRDLVGVPAKRIKSLWGEGKGLAWWICYLLAFLPKPRS